MSRLWPLFLLFAALILARPALAGDVARDDLPRTLFEQQYKVIENRRAGMAGYFASGAAMADGGITVVGTMTHKDDSVAHSGAWVVRFDLAGTLLWRKEYPVPGRNDDLFAATTLLDGSLLVAGRDRRAGHRRAQGLLMRLNATGTPAWRRVVRATGDLSFWGVAATPDGGAVAIGRWEKTQDQTHDSIRALLVRVDNRGRLVWQRAMPVKLGSRINRVYATGHDDFVVLGAATTEDKGDQAVVTALGVSGDGKVLWRHSFGSAVGTFDVSYAYAPHLGFAVARAVDKRTLVVERWDAERHFLWSAIDRKIADEIYAKVLFVGDAPFLLRPEGGLMIALRAPFESTAPTTSGVLLDYDSAGTRRSLGPLDTPRERDDQYAQTITALGNDKVAVVGGTVHYPEQGFSPVATTEWLRSWVLKKN